MPERLERLYDEHADALFAFVLNMTRHEADTRDVLQDVFRRLAERPNLLDGARDQRAYLLRMAHHAAVDGMRRRSTREKCHSGFAAEKVRIFEAAPDADEQVYREALAKALAELPPEQRAVAHLKLWEGLTFAEIAETLELSPNTAASRFRYAIDKLRAHLRPLYEELKESWTTSKPT